MIDDLSDIGGVIEDFASTYVVTRAGTVDFTDHGRPTEAAATTFNITALIQPPNSKDLQRMPEGLRTEQTRILWTNTALVLDPQPDTVSAEGLTWQVETASQWLGGYYRCVIRKVG